MPTACRVIIADDHVAFRECVSTMLAGCPAFDVIGQAGDGRELLKLLKDEPAPDVIILDLSMPRLGGLKAIRALRKDSPKVRVLVLTMHKEEDLLCQAFLEGADGYLLKDDWPTELLTALGTIRKSEGYVSPTAARALENPWLKIFIANKGSHFFEELSSQELEVLALLAKGESSSGIAHTLHITPHAVGHHQAAITRKLHVEDTPDLAR